MKATLDLVLEGSPIYDPRTLPDQLKFVARRLSEAAVARTFKPKEKQP